MNMCPGVNCVFMHTSLQLFLELILTVAKYIVALTFLYGIA